MLRELSAIGLSRFTSQAGAARLVDTLLKEKRFHGYKYQVDGRNMVELYREMGPFQVAMRGPILDDMSIKVSEMAPVLREKRNYLLIEWEMHVDAEGDVILTGQDKFSLEPLCMVLTDKARFYSSREGLSRKELPVSCYGLCTDGKILLGVHRTAKDWERKSRQFHWKRDKLLRAMQGDENAMIQLEKAEDEASLEVERRMMQEDLLTIYDEFVFESGEKENEFLIMGGITGVDKLFNPYSEEWVYYLDMIAADQFFRVLVSPSDLTGEPAEGRRFVGKVRFYGRLDPLRLLSEGIPEFF